MVDSNLRDEFGKYLIKVGIKNKNIVVLDADLSLSTRTSLFAKEFPERFFNIGIAEQNMIGIASGLALSGKIPIVSGFSIFTTGRGWEFIRLACHDNLNLKIITTHSGIVGEDGSSHHALQDISIMSILPNLTVLVPSDSYELLQLLDYAIKSSGPFYIRLPRASFFNIHDSDYEFLIGKPDVLKGGKDFGLIGTGYGSNLAYKLAPKIEKKLKISLKVINMPTIKPINELALVEEIKDLKGIISIEEHNIYCGFGSILARIISKHYPIFMEFIGIKNSYGESGQRSALLDSYNINYHGIVECLKKLMLKSI